MSGSRMSRRMTSGFRFGRESASIASRPVEAVSIVTSDPSNARVRLVGVPDPRQVRELVRNAAYQATRGQLFTRST